MIHWLIHTYWPEVRGNVYAVAPCGAVAFAWLRSKHLALQRAHEAHSKKLDAVLIALDPESESETQLDLIADRVNEQTPGGLKAVLDAINSR